MISSKMVINILVALTSIAAPSAFAQHGSVNGPTTGGPLNPASGAMTVTLSKLFDAEDDCYFALTKDMLDPFLNIQQIDPKVVTTIYDGNVPYDRKDFKASEKEYLVAGLLVNISGSTGPLSLEILKNYPRFNWVWVEFPTDDHPSPYADGSGSVQGLKFVISDSSERSSLTRFSDLYQLSTKGFPKVGYTKSDRAIYDPISHVKIGTEVAVSDLEGVWIGGVAPTNPEKIQVQNTDTTDSNFRINGAQFFKCVESKL
jgi:hypothetical protein